MTRTVRVLRVFTRDGAGGNPLGVHDGILGDNEMQAVAAELGYSETVFLGDPLDGVVPARIFTPSYEMPFAGHPLVGPHGTRRDPMSPCYSAAKSAP